MKNRQNVFLFLLIVLFGGSCVEPYEPAILSQDHHYLVVEGFLNSGAGSSQVQLSRTTGLTEFNIHEPESQASVFVESEKGGVYYFQENFGGTYILEPLDLDFNDRYRLKVVTADGKEYLSDYVEVKETPPIDSVSWKLEDGGLHIYVNTHDPQNNSRYYRWEYEETWEYNVPFSSSLIYDGERVVLRPNPTPSNCWKYATSSTLLIGSSAKLQQDKISLQPIIFIPRADRKLSSRYSIMVKQYVLSKKAFEYYRQMEKNSEELGSFFDPQPSEVGGNISSITSPGEPVIGYFSVGSQEQQRIFIDNEELPGWGFKQLCVLEEVLAKEAATTFGGGSLTPVYEGMPGLYYGVHPTCADCSLGANPEKPDYW